VYLLCVYGWRKGFVKCTDKHAIYVNMTADIFEEDEEIHNPVGEAIKFIDYYKCKNSSVLPGMIPNIVERYNVNTKV
jgi:hypothetical protein